MKQARWLKLSAALFAMLFALCAASSAGAATALEFRSVGATPAIMYDAPSAKGRKVSIAPRGMPVEVVLAYGEWVKVRDATGDLSWVETKHLTAKRHLVIKTASARVRAAAEEGAPVVFTADKGVLLELVEPAGSGWVRVKHRDGQSGFVRASDVWGE